MWQDRDVEAVVRERVRALRLDQGTSLAELGERCNMSASMISRLETGERRLTVDHLAALARGLGVAVDELLAMDTDEPRINPVAHKARGMTVWPLSHGPSANGIVAHKMRFASSRRKPDLQQHPGREWLYVLNGRLRLIVGERDHILNPGEAAEFSTTRPHWMGAIDGPVEVLTLLGPEGQAAHLHPTD
ncbi:helix-turn-helix domain-containing protein [Aquihabitans sp. McL0605]|uniref:helix-turn-helix domain-containing protein n=1 Tax=Aquihabitans sp. McL0605 TaxID=3415671 RepID=UPI003CE76C3E